MPGGSLAEQPAPRLGVKTMPTDRSASSIAAAAQVDDVIAELRKRRDALTVAEQEVERIPDLLTQAEKILRARRSKAKRRSQALEDEAQAIRDRLRGARFDLQETMRGLAARVSAMAVHSEAGRAVLTQLGRLSPYPSVRAGDAALYLLAALQESRPVAQADLSAKLASLPHGDPSLEDRRVMAELIEKAMEVRKDSRKTAQAGIKLSEHTLERLLDAEGSPEKPFRRSTWKKALSFVRNTLADPVETHKR